MDLAVNCIESRRKLKGKVQEWYDNPELIFPLKLSAEQCSSSATGRYKAALARAVYEQCREDGSEAGMMRIADLTGGFGVDTWHFSRLAEEVLYCEMQSILCDAARHNFKALGAENIRIENITIASESQPHHPEHSHCHPERSEGSPSLLLSDFRPDIIYLDPARRSETGKKVFLIEECTPDVLKIKDDLFACCRHILLKLSPMADISMVCARLGEHCREVHVVATGGECKELLIWMDREWAGEYTITATEICHPEHQSCHSEHQSCHPERSEGSPYSSLRFTPSEEKASVPATATKEDITRATHLFEPGKALMKSGAFNITAARLGLSKLGRSTHYYLMDKISEEARHLGKTYKILSCRPLDKRSIKEAGKEFPHSEVTARNIPMDTDAFRKKLGVTSGDDAHIFGLKSDTSGNLIFICRNQF